MANKITIDIEARFVDKVTSGIQKAEKSLDNLEKKATKAKKTIDTVGKSNAKPKITADSTKFDKVFSKTQQMVNKLKNTKAAVVINALDQASSKIGTVLNKAKNFAGKQFKAYMSVHDTNALDTLGRVSNKAREISGKVWKGTVRVIDAATAPIRTIYNALFNLKTLFAAVVAGFAAQKLIIQPIGLADAYSSAQIGFSTLLGETQGQQMMDDLDAFAKATPFKTSEVIANTQKMIAMGWAAEDIIKDMTIIGDAAAATGKGDEGLNRIVLALAQIKSKGKLSTEELNQLAEAGISAKRYLAEGLGYGSGDEGLMALSKDLEGGKIGAEAALAAIKQGMLEYQGMMDKTANETVEGLKSQLEDTFEINILRRWGQGLQDGAKRGLGAIVSLVDDADAALMSLGDTIYELGDAISTWVADKLENVVKRITEISESFEFKNASLSEKLKMLWKGAITDPLKEWWENGGQAKTAETAGKIGAWLGKAMTAGILGILGMTDIFDESGLGETGGASIGASFARGFVDNFDVSAITSKIVDAIGNVWGALPAWAKILVGGYAATKLASTVQSVAGVWAGVAGNSLIQRVIGSAGTNMVAGSGLTGAAANLGYALTGGAAASTLSGGAAAALGAGTVAGGLGVAYGAYSVGKNVSNGIQAYKNNNMTEVKANAAQGGTTLAYMGTGALIGSAFGGIPGALIGGGLGAVAGLLMGSNWAKNIRKDAEAANYSTEEMKDAIKDTDMSAEELSQTFQKAVYEDTVKRFGKMALSLNEISRISQQIAFGPNQEIMDQFGLSVKQAEASLTSFKSAAEDLKRWNWKAGLGVKFNADEIEEIQKTVEEYITSAQSYVENQHYEFTTAVSLLVDVESEGGKSIIDSGNAYYQKIQEELNSLGAQLTENVNIALEDGVITLDEQAEIQNLQQQIADITTKLANAQTEANMELIKVKFGKDNIDYDSFVKLQEQLQTDIQTSMDNYDQAFTASVASLQLQLEDGAITQEDYNAQIQTLIEGYETQVDELKVRAGNLQFEILADSYSDILGDDGISKLQSALDTALKEGIDPAQWTLDEARRLLGVDTLSAEAATAIGEMLAAINTSFELMEIDGQVYLKLTSNSTTAASSTKTSAQTALDKAFKPGLKETVPVKLTPKKNILSKVSLTASDFGIPSILNKTVTLNITQKTKTTKAKDDEYRGGIVGPNGHIRGFSSGGYVAGGGQLVRVAEEGTPEVIIPLSERRRDRAMRLWQQTGRLLNVPGFAEGGIVGDGISRGAVQLSDSPVSGNKSVSIEVGGITLNVNVEGGQDAVEAIRAQKETIAEEIAGILNKAISEQYQNMSSRKGA